MFLNKFTNNIDDPLHTNTFAAAAKASGGMGTTGPQSFSQRLYIERNRQNVNRYHDSMLVHRHREETANHRFDSAPPERPSSEAETPSMTDRTAPQRMPRRLISDIAKPTSRPRFSEPPTRGYNPYK